MASSLVDETPRRRTSEPATPDIKPIPRHSLLSHRRIHASPPAGRFPVLKGKRKAEKYADIEHDTRSRIAVDESSLPRPGSVRINRAGSRWSKENLRISSDDEVRKNEAISPVSVGGLGLDSSVIVGPPPLKRGASNPEVYPRHNDDEEKQDDGVGELRNDFVRNVQKFQEGNSVYPSSPPMMQSQYLPGEEYEDDEEEDNEKNYLDDTVSQYIAPKRPPPTPPSPAYRPNSKEGAPNHGSHGSALLRNIRSHKDAPRSPIKALEPIPPKSPPSSDDDPDSFMAPHPFRNVPGLSAPAPHSPPGEKLNVPKNKHSGSPLKLFSGAYDTYTNDRLWKRLGELEKSEEQESARPSRAASLERSTDHGTEGSDGDSEGSFSGGSRVLSRLEKMVLKAERQASPVRANYSRRRHTKMVHYGDSAEEPTKSDRRMSEPVLQPSSPQLSVRKHRRWRSDESSGTPNDGVAGPMNPVKERTPKRPRRGTILTPRPGSSGVPNQLFESPVAGRRRIYGGIEEGSILASSRRQQRSRANSKESQVSARRVSATSVAATSSPTPNPRKKKHVMRDAGQVAAPAINSPRSKGSRKIVFSGCGGDGMHGESFEMPTPDKSDGDRKGSVTTQDFLLQAEEVMARLRSIAMASSGSGSSSRRGSQEVADVDQSTVPGECRRGNQSREASLSSANAGQKKAVAPRSDEPRYEEEEQEELRQSRSSRSSRLSVRVISNVPEVLAHHLATKTTNDMTFDEKSHAWISRDPGKDREEDPLQDISDLTVDPKEEERVLEMARQRWVALGSTPEGVEKSGVWRSSRVIDDSDIRELREQGCSIGGDTWDKTHWSHSRALSSSVGSASSRQTSGSGFGASCPGTGTETRTTSYGTEGNADKDVKETEMEHNDDDTTNESDVKSECEAQQRPARFDDGFSSSPLKYEVILDDSNVDGFLDHGSLRRRNPNSSFGSYRATNAHRKPLGKSFVGRPVSRITEESEDTGSHRIMEREFRKISLSSALTPIQTPFKSHLSFMPPPSESRKGEVSFYLSPLPDLSYRFETTEALVSLELSYITSRRGPKASSKAIEASFSIAQENLVKHMTDVEPYNPYWEHIKSLKLSDRRLETLHPLNEWCPMISELDVCDNELGQLAGVPETVLNLNAQRNCLSNSTYFGHLANLQFLDISGNGLESLEALRTCVHLREIRADDNALTSISGVFQIDGLMSLRCRRNRLWSVDVSRTDLYAIPLIPSQETF